MIPLPYTLAAAGIALVASFFLGYNYGLEKYYDLKSAVAQEQNRAAAESERVTGEIAKGWANSLAWHRNNPRIVRVRDNCGVQVPGTPGGIDGRPPHQRLGAGGDATLTASQCETRLNDALGDAAQLMALQAWIKQQNQVTK